MSSLSFRLAHGEEDLERILECRWRGFGPKYGFDTPRMLRDALDMNAYHYLCVDRASGQVLGVMRMCSAREGALEQPAGSVERWLNEYPDTAEITRLSVPRTSRSSLVKAGLWKLVWRHCLKTGHSHAVTYVRKGAFREYLHLGFSESALLPAPFRHRHLADSTHYVLGADFSKLEQWARRDSHPLYHFMCVEEHPNIELV